MEVGSLTPSKLHPYSIIRLEKSFTPLGGLDGIDQWIKLEDGKWYENNYHCVDCAEDSKTEDEVADEYFGAFKILSIGTGE